MLDIVLNILIKNIYNYWAEATKNINIFFSFIIEAAIIAIVGLAKLIKSFILTSETSNQSNINTN